MLGFAPIAALPLADDALQTSSSSQSRITSFQHGGSRVATAGTGNTRISTSIQSTVRIRVR